LQVSQNKCFCRQQNPLNQVIESRLIAHKRRGWVSSWESCFQKYT